MKNAVKRVILFVVALPGLTLLSLFVPHLSYVWATLLLATIGLLCGNELRNMFAGNARILPRWSILFPGIAPVLGWMVSMGWFPPISSLIALFLSLLWALGGVAFTPENDFHDGIDRIGRRLIIVLYPGFFLWWIQAITQLPLGGVALLVFMLTVFFNDSAAWLFGMLLGKHRGMVAVSPNKSVEGFIAGIFASTVVIIASSYWIPELFPHPLWQLLLFGLVAGSATIFGDLVESAIKRSAGVKDSGKFVLGRGGILDSVDSLLFTAPLFALFMRVGV